jgi:DNA-binding beta-propeller fold protein YncE
MTVTATSGSISHTTNFSVAVATAAPFTIHPSPSAVSIGPATYQPVQITVTAAAGTSPNLTVNLSELPTNVGVNLLFPGGFLTPTSPVQFTVEAGVLAQSLSNFPIVITASDSSGNSSVAVLPLTVSVGSSNLARTRSTFARTDQSPTGVVYDQARKLLFVTVELLNEVAVLSSVDGHRVATIPVACPAGIDEASDGSAVYVVSPYIGTIATIDPDSLQVVQQTPLPQTAGTVATASQIATLFNAKAVIALANHDNSVPPLYLWDPSNDTFAGIGQGIIGSYEMARTADHSHLLISGFNNLIYDAATNTFSNPINFGGPALAISPDGSQVVGGAGGQTPTVFYDSHGNVLGSISLSPLITEGLLYSLDGTRAYVLERDLISNDDVAAVIDTKTFALLGVVPGFPFGTAVLGLNPGQLAVDETQMLFGPVSRGVGFLDASSPGSLELPLSTASLMSPTLVGLTSPTSATLNGAYFSTQLSYGAYFGASPASPQTLVGTVLQVQNSSSLSLTVPAGISAGPANLTLTRSDGAFTVLPDAVTYGPTVLQVDPNVGSPSGGDSASVTGYGFEGSNLQVTIGGKPAANLQVRAAVSGQLFPTESISFTTPSGVPGFADITVSTSKGSTTVSNGFQYASSAQLYPMAGALDAIAYDQVRQKLYITNQDHNRVEVFDLSSKVFLTPIPVGNQPTAIALTPDGARLGVTNSADATMSVIDPNTRQILSQFSVVPPQDTNCNIPLNMSAIAPHRVLLNLSCPGTSAGGVFRLVDLDTGSLSCTGVAGCESNGTDLLFGNCCGLGFSASIPDGTKVFLAGFRGGVALLDLTANAVTYGYQGGFTDAAADSDGSLFASSFSLADLQLDQVATMAAEPYARVGVAGGLTVPGEKLSPTGSLLFLPQTTGIAIFDVHTGRIAQNVALADGIPADTNAMALDETGTRMFVISNSGVTIAQLFQAPLSLATVTPSTGAPGTVVKLRGSGFLSGTTVAFGTLSASVTYVDQNTLMATVPAAAPGSVRITLTNPSAQPYDFDNAFNIQ